MLIDPELLKKTGVFTLASGEIAAYVGSGYFLGNWIDHKIHAPVVFGILLPLVGLGYCCLRIIRRFKSETK